MKKNLFLLSAIVLSGAMFSCASSEDIDSSETKQVVNMLSEPEPIQLTQEQKLFAKDNNGFTLNFLKTVNDVDKSGKSFIYSPLSITYVLGMVNDAATGQTEQELEQTLGFHQGGIQAVNDYCKKLIDGLPKVDNTATLNIANAIFLNKEYTLKNQFQKDMETYYDAKAEALDFNASGTLGHINGWCNDKTNGMIPSILDEINPKMVSYLLNAIYFKADWASKFDQKNTKEENFTTDKGNVKLPLMHQKVLISYLNNGTYSAIEMPYGNGYWNMTVMLPEEGKTTDDIINYLADNTIQMSGARAYEVDLKLPRFETSSDMCEDSYLYISMMRQKAKIKVNEEGSEAAAVTVTGMLSCTSIPEPVEYPKATFHANRPFVYAITEASSGVILFVGKFTGK